MDVFIDDFIFKGKIENLEIGSDADLLNDYEINKYVGGIDTDNNDVLLELKLFSEVRFSVKIDIENKIKYISLPVYRNSHVNFFLKEASEPFSDWNLMKIKEFLEFHGKNYILENKLNGLVKIFKIKSPLIEIVYSYEDSDDGKIDVISVFGNE